MPVTSAQSYCTEAARAAALASHSAASLADAAGLREAARLLRSSEALARAATAALLAAPRREGGVPDAGDGAGKLTHAKDPKDVDLKVKRRRPRRRRKHEEEEEEGLAAATPTHSAPAAPGASRPVPHQASPEARPQRR